MSVDPDSSPGIASEFAQDLDGLSVGSSTVEYTDSPQPRLNVGTGPGDLLAAYRESFPDGCAGARRCVVANRRAQSAHRVRGEREDGLASEVKALGERRHDHGRPDVPDRTAQQHNVVALDRRQRVR